MKILKKRAIALLIDGLILGVYYELLKLILPESFFNFGTVSYIVIFAPFFFRDCAFKNASIGKKIMGIEIFTTTWSKPNILHLAKRSLYITTLGYALWWKLLVSGESMVTLFEWEQKKVKTTIISKKVFKELKEKTQCGDENFQNKLLNSYNEYLQREH